ncbi:DUF6216 family protein [Gilliamella sp. GillExp13]|uniref:DUF6216 family protein n=1 Tax=Gilliamella sp. GillExp13 TaxID=3120243 RepID=UPI00080E0848|nr:DUF6216 family protein [Gilliamella apicola]OCG63484.1 hypothetical protein A9G37_09035 [Gilliamella apicola]
MDYNQFFNSINVFIEAPIFKYIEIVIVILLVIYLSLKWKIVIFLKDRLWGILLGKKNSEFFNEQWKEFHNNNIDIAHFNALYHVSANTERQIEKYLKWLKRNGISAIQVIKIKSLFDINKLSFKKIRSGKLSALIIGDLALFFIALFCLNFVVTSAALIKVGENSPWFWVSDSYARSSQISLIPFTNTNWDLTPSMCNTKEFNAEKWSTEMNLPKTLARNICEHFANKESKDKISNIVKEQKIFFGFNCVLILVYFLYIFTFLSQVFYVRDLRLQIKRHRTKKWSK